MLFQNKIGLNISDSCLNSEDLKTGNELRKNRKKQKQEDLKITQRIPDKKNNSGKDSSKKETKKFVLGNGIEGLNPRNLVDLIYSTTPLESVHT
jgi:hypothetical protein